MKNNLHVLLGATVADAAARPLHWVYDQKKLLTYIKGKKDFTFLKKNKPPHACVPSDGNRTLNHPKVMDPTHWWGSPDRGKVRLGWTLSPALVELGPVVLEYMRKTMSENDDFVGAPSGVGFAFHFWGGLCFFCFWVSLFFGKFLWFVSFEGTRVVWKRLLFDAMLMRS